MVQPATVFAQQPAAQGQAQGQGLEEITVTGSRILRRDYTANAPITTIDQNAFQATSTIGVETVLNQLPQFVPAITQFTTTDVQQTANNTIGGSFVSLRGLGPNRNLILIDGKRAQPFNPQMYVDTNMIPAAAIQRVELITGGASAVYGADAVGGVVNFILKDNFEGASVETRVQDTDAGGGQEILVSGLIGVNGADDRGNVMIGIEHATRTKVEQWGRDWRVADMANPATPATAFGWGSDPWFSSTIPGFGVGDPLNFDALNVGNFPSQTFVNNMFGGAGAPAGYVSCTDNGAGFFGNNAGTCTQDATGTNLGVPNNVRFLLNRATGTVYTGLMDNAGAAGAYRYDGPLTNGDTFGNFVGLPFRVYQPNGAIKENNFWQWSTYPLERNSAFAKGHYDVSDNVKVTGSALFTRTHSKTSLGLGADNITFWGAPIPFSNNIYTGDSTRGIPSSLNLDGTTNASYLPGGRFGLNCDADGVPGCTEREAWPLPPQVVALMDSRAINEAPVWLSAPPDYLRQAIGPRAGDVTNTTSQLSLGVEGDTPGGRHHWDVTISSGYTDNLTIQSGSSRLSTYRAMMASPNFGRGFIADPNPYITGFAESIATCTSGLPVTEIFQVSSDCVTMMSPDLKNQEALKQNTIEANIAGDLAQMKAGTLSYALGADYREDSYKFEPDNLSQNQNFIDPIAGLFPNENSGGKYDVKEVYGEMLIPIVSNGPKGVEHFNFEIGGRVSDWSMPGVDTLSSYKFLVDWGFSPKYRLRGGINRAHRAPNLGELFSARTQLFALGGAANGDQCSQLNTVGPFSTNPAIAGAAQAQQSLDICTAMMGQLGTAQYYGTLNPVVGVVANTSEPQNGGVGIQNQLGNVNLQEEDADTFTIGVVMDFLENWTLSVDYYTIEIKQMIALESADSIYERCLSLNYNPTGDINSPACQLIYRDPTSGNAANIDRVFSNEGRAKVSGVDLQLNWSKMLAKGGFNLNAVMNYNFGSETQDREDLATRDWAGTTGCALQIQCQEYEYRLFTTLSYFRGPWSISLRHQYWPSVLPDACGTTSDPAGQAAVAAACAAAKMTGTGNGVSGSYQLFALSGSYRFGDKYTLRVGVENLLDELPPVTGTNPYALPYANPGTRSGLGLGTNAGATYDPLGRREYISFTMDF